MKKTIFLVSIVLLAASIRFVPHIPNVTPIGAMALFGGVYLERRYVFFVTFGAMFLSDLFLGFHMTMIFVYLSFFITILLGIWLQIHKSIKKVLLCSLASSVLFFLITNFGVWLMYSFYPKTILGLVDCYVAGIPFFRNTLVGDLFYVTLFFGAYELAKNLFKQYRKLTI